MYLRINSKLGLSFAENVIKSVGSGVATNLAGYAVGMGVASAIKEFVDAAKKSYKK